MLVIAGVTGILAMIIFGLLPQLAGTFANLGKSIQEFIPQVQGWADHWFHNNKEIMNVVNNLEFDWNKIMEAAAGFLKNGAGSVLETTINTAKNIIGAVGTFFIAFVFAVYILLQKEKLGRQAEKVLFAFVRKGRAEAVLEVLALTYRTLKLSYRPVPGSCDSRLYVCCYTEHFENAVCTFDRQFRLHLQH